MACPLCALSAVPAAAGPHPSPLPKPLPLPGHQAPGFADSLPQVWRGLPSHARLPAGHCPLQVSSEPGSPVGWWLPALSYPVSSYCLAALGLSCCFKPTFLILGPACALGPGPRFQVGRSVLLPGQGGPGKVSLPHAVL